MSTTTKRCADCKEHRPTTEFMVRKRDGLFEPYCRTCYNRRQRARHQRRKARIHNPPAARKRCGRCNTVKPGSDFYAVPVARDGLHSEGRQCGHDRAMERRARVGYKRPAPPPAGYKRCGGCKEVKPVTAFSKNQARPDGVEAHCPDCRRRPQKDRYLRHKYKITLAEYEAMAERQGQACAICGNPETSRHPGTRGNKVMGGASGLSVDHDHMTNAVRSLLCYRCNHFVGYVERFGLAGVRKVLEYLRRHGLR